MKKETKELFKTIIKNQELIMKALNIEVPKKEAITKAVAPKKVIVKKTIAKK